MLQAIVTGASGFIGSAFVSELTRNGIEVFALGRKRFKDIRSDRKLLLSGASYIELDMASINLLNVKLSNQNLEIGDDCIFINLAWAGLGRLSDSNVQAQYNNVVNSILAIETALKLGCRKFVHVGTMEEAFAESYLTLDHNINQESNRHLIYAVAKTAARRALQLKARQIGMEYIFVNHSHVMGLGDEKDSFLQVTLEKILNNEELLLSSGAQYFDVISLEDCVKGYYAICKKGLSGHDYWVGSGDPQLLKDYVKRMFQLFPSQYELRFGGAPIKDVVLDREIFSTALLFEHTGYTPTMSFEDIVIQLASKFNKD